MRKSQSTLRAAAVSFSTKPRVGDATAGHTGARVKRAVGTIDTTITLLECNGERLCIFASHYGTSVDDATQNIQRAIGDVLGLTAERILVFSSHNHSVPLLETRQRTGYEEKPEPSELTAFGRVFVRQVCDAARGLPEELEPVSVWFGEGREDRITYNRKGRRPDGSTYLMREEDRALVGADFAGDIDTEAPVVVLKRADGSAVTAIVQFNGHPVTMYHPEKLIASGDWPQIACRMLAKKLRGVPVSFLQGCAGDVNSKHMFSASVKLAEKYGAWLGAAYCDAARRLKRSERDGFDFETRRVGVPLAGVPAAATLLREIAEIRAFVKRANKNDQDTLSCVGLNFPRAMSPAYRGKLVEYVLPWSQWALKVRRGGKQGNLPRALPLDVYVLRIGDVAIVGMPTEPFMGIGRQIRAGSPFALTIPCGYVNQATGFVGYIPDSANSGDREYMSAFHRYTRFLPAFRRPAGDVLARPLRLRRCADSIEERRSMADERLYEIGPNSQVDADVVLGYQYRGNTKPLVIGANAIIRSGTIIYANTRIGKRFTTGHQVIIRAQCEIGDRVVILHQCTLEGMITIGDGVKIMAHVYIPSRTKIGRFVFIGPGCTFLNAKYPMRDPSTPKGATLGEGVCVGGGVTICPGVTIGERSFIGAGSVVNKDVPADTLAYGVPARFHPLPERLKGGNWPELAMTGTDLWGGQQGDDWRVDFPRLPPRPFD